MNRLVKIMIFTLLSVLLIVACSKKQVEEPSDDLKEIEKPIVEPAEEPIMYMAPFTGEMKEEESLRRPVIATINNHPLARPQSGISDADIIYEFIAEGNVTRFLALFQSELPEEIGPIRSARDYFIHVAEGLDAFYVAHGYSPDALALLQAGYVDHVNGMQHDGTLFKRSTDRKAPHNSYISNENIEIAAERTNSRMEITKLPPLSFHESIESAKIGDVASSIIVQNGSHPNFTSTYTYNEDSGTYERSVNGIATIDKANEKTLELSNILVFEADYQTIDNAGRQSVNIETGGKAMLFHGGISKEIEWENIDGILTPVENGIPAKLVPGKTWIHVIRANPGITSNVSYTP